MNKLFLSDTHCQTFHKSHFNSKPITDILYSYFDFGLEKDLNNDSNDTILMLGGDIWNLACVDYSYDKIDIDNDTDSIMFIRYFEFIKKYADDRGLDIKKVLFVEGNHDFRFFGFSPFQYPFFGRNLSTIFTEEVIQKVFGDIPFIYLRENVNIEYNEIFLGNMLFSPCIDYKTLLKGESDFSINRMLSSLGDFEHLTNILDNYLTQTRYIDIPFLNDTNLDQFSDLVKLKEVFMKVHHILLSKLLGGNDISSERHNISIFVFLYHFLTLISQIIENKSETIDTINLITHFPFNYKDNLFQYGKDFTGIKYKEFGDKQEPKNDSLNPYFQVDFSMLDQLLKIITKQYPKLKKINLYNGHTHDNYSIKAKYKGINFNVFNNSIGYGQEISNIVDTL